MPIRFKLGDEANKENVGNKGGRAFSRASSLSPTRDFDYRFDNDPESPRKQQAWAEKYEQGQGFDSEGFLDVAVGELREQFARVMVQSREEGSGSVAGDDAVLDKFFQGAAWKEYQLRLRHQFQELDKQSRVRKLGDGRGSQKRKEAVNDENESMGEEDERQERDFHSSQQEYFSDLGSEHIGFIAESGQEPVLGTKLPTSYGPARNTLQRKADPVADGRDHL